MASSKVISEEQVIFIWTESALMNRLQEDQEPALSQYYIMHDFRRLVCRPEYIYDDVCHFWSLNAGLLYLTKTKIMT